MAIQLSGRDTWVTQGTATTTYVSGGSDWFGQFTTEVTPSVEMTIKKERGLPPHLYFNFVKNNVTKMEETVLKKKLAKIEKAAEKAIDNGQNVLADKMLKQLTLAAKEVMAFDAGVRYYIDRDVLWRNKTKIRGGHISNTRYEDWQRTIPEDVVEAKKKVDGIFDTFEIFHYYSKEQDKIYSKELSPSEKAKMKDPILFGLFKETERYYLIADWIDEQCDLTFEQIIDVLAEEEDDLEYKLSGTPRLGEDEL